MYLDLNLILSMALTAQDLAAEAIDPRSRFGTTSNPPAVCHCCAASLDRTVKPAGVAKPATSAYELVCRRLSQFATTIWKCGGPTRSV